MSAEHQGNDEGRPLVGDVIAGRYRIESVAGEGGMGIVYEAEHVILRQRVALKALLPGTVTSTEDIDRFSLEASAIARIANEHVVRVMDAGSLPGGAPYLVMEYLDGQDLSQVLLRRGPLPPAEVVDFALQALEALAHAHAAHVIHRDLKPANLFLARLADGRSIIKLVDFGVSQSVDRNAGEERRGHVAGSPGYMSPEQLRGEVVDERSDVWSLGVVLYELLAGAPPFEGETSDLVTAILEVDAPNLTSRTRAVSAALAEVIACCLRRDPSERWGSTLALARALAPFGSGAWEGAVARIERALSSAVPMRSPRRFETLENALQALDAAWNRQEAADTTPPPTGYEASEPAKVSSPETYSPTIRAPAYEGAAGGARTLPSRWHKPAIRILVIDDSDLMLGMHEEVLRKAGFDVRTTTSVRQFEALLSSWKPQLVLIDVLMPGITGDVLCRSIKDRFRAALPVVLLSDLPRAVLAERARVAKADAFFTKADGWPALVDVVRQICAIAYSPEDLP